MDPIAVHIYLTPVCNLTCTHCYYDAMGPNDDPGPILRIDELVNSITWLCERFDADLHLEGGEMFLRSDVDEILAALPPQCLSALTLTTSGTVPIRVRPELLKKVGDLRILSKDTQIPCSGLCVLRILVGSRSRWRNFVKMRFRLLYG